LLWDTRGGGTGSTGNTGGGGWASGWVVTVEPEHVDSVVVPERHDEDHTVGKVLAHLRHTSEGLEFVHVLGGSFLLLAECVADGVGGGYTSHICVGILNDNSVLNIDSLDLAESTGAGSVVGNKLCNNGEEFGGVDGLSRTVERLVAEAEGVEVAPVLVADTIISVVGIVTAVIASATSLAN